MLTPVRATTDGSLQPFRFVALGDDDHRALRMVVDSAADRSFQGAPIQPVGDAEVNLKLALENPTSAAKGAQCGRLLRHD